MMLYKPRSWKAGFPKNHIIPEVQSDPHPLDGCDAEELYKVMMSERTELIKARRESEDNFVKTIIQLSSALLVLLAGFSVNSKDKLNLSSETLFQFCAIATMAAIIFGLLEHHFSSKAYQRQQELLESYYSKNIKAFSEPIENFYVRLLHILQFLAFALALLLVAIFASSQVGENHDREKSSAARTAFTTET